LYNQIKLFYFLLQQKDKLFQKDKLYSLLKNKNFKKINYIIKKNNNYK
jgi:hypothetical protein